MPIYEEEGRVTREDLLDLRKKNVCKECGANLNMYLDPESGKAFVACWDYLRTKHEGIEREASEYERKGLDALTINTRRKIMEQELGPEKTKALTRYMGVVSLTRPQAREILEAVFPDAPDDEVARAVMLCASYGLNPLMKHIFLIKFNRWSKDRTRIVGEDWATVMGIKAKRLLASRRGSCSYVDNTPRLMTQEEQKTILGEVEADKLWVITKLKDPQTGAEAVGYGFWPKGDKPYGTEKGNTKFNMAAIRSESQALDRLRPGEMPQGVEAIDEQYITSVTPFISKGVDKIGELGEVSGGGEGEASETILSTPKQETKKPAGAPPAQPEGEGFIINPDWLKETLGELNWSDETCKTFLVSQYKISSQGTLEEVIKRLTRGQAEEFVHEIQERVTQKQMGL